MPDITARMLAPRLTDSLGQPVIVDNRPGGGGVLGSRLVAEATPDGYTLLATSSSHVLAPAVHAKLPYDTTKDFAGITRTSTASYVLTIAPGLGVTNIKDLLALAKAKPGQLNFASAGVGSGTHFAAEMLKFAAGMNVVHVPYKGIPEALTDTMTGRVQFFMSPLASALALVKEGKLRAIAVTAAQRVRAYPDVPTVAEAALPGFRFDSWSGLLAPGKTPRAIVNKLNQEVVRMIVAPEIAQRIASLGAEPAPTTPAEFDKLIAEEVQLAAKLARQAGIKPE
jgi:tripartite-type tricarboxylate transporter receptor subunit TctC